MTESQTTRINKYLSETGYCSRREADRLINEGRVTINGSQAELGSKVSANDEVKVNGKLLARPKENFVYIAFNKPVGIVCTTDVEHERNNIIDYISHPKRIFPIGRLDKDSEGLILLTSDGDIVNKILRAKNNHEKEYIVRVDRKIDYDFINKMSNGIPILDTVTNKCLVKKIDDYTFNIILTQGLNRQIRRMCEYLDYKVVKLKRIRIMNITLDLPVGQWRDLTEDEMRDVNSLISTSSKTFD